MRHNDEIKMLSDLVASLCIKNAIDKNIPKYLYHFSDINNILNIVDTNKIYSRNRAIELGLMLNDNASKEVIEKTMDSNRDYVRLYFRPKTPTQYHNEGLKSEHKSYPLDAHCPIPIFLCFCTVSVLSRKDTGFVEQNLATNPSIYSSIKDLLNFDFGTIYHTGTITNDDPKNTVSKRQAEVLIEKELTLDALRYIYCRSVAEKETFEWLLREKNIEVNVPIRVDTRSILFNKRRTFIDFVELKDKEFTILFGNIEKLHKDDVLSIKMISEKGIKSKKYSNEELIPKSKFNMVDAIEGDYILKIFLNDKLIYCGKYIHKLNLPF